jgi:hypothetical protein
MSTKIDGYKSLLTHLTIAGIMAGKKKGDEKDINIEE